MIGPRCPMEAEKYSSSFNDYGRYGTVTVRFTAVGITVLRYVTGFFRTRNAVTSP